MAARTLTEGQQPGSPATLRPQHRRCGRSWRGRITKSAATETPPWTSGIARSAAWALHVCVRACLSEMAQGNSPIAHLQARADKDHHRRVSQRARMKVVSDSGSGCLCECRSCCPAAPQPCAPISRRWGRASQHRCSRSWPTLTASSPAPSWYDTLLHPLLGTSHLGPNAGTTDLGQARMRA